MIHGFGGSNRDFYILDSLINKNYRVIRVDLPGFGLSDFPKQTALNPDYTKVYDQYFNFLLDTLHIDSCYAMGNSLGGLMAWNLAIKHPSVVKKLVLFNSAGYDMPEVMKTANANIFRNQLVQQIVKKGIPTFMIKRGIGRVFYNPTILTEEKVKRVSDFWNREGNLQHIINMANANTYLDEKLIQKITCPTLIVWGKQDQIISVKYAERFHSDIKGSQEIIYDSCGHVPMLERPLDTERDVLKFLQ
jgi:pimeloyl-ACP methyl ester carboxylesterase